VLSVNGGKAKFPTLDSPLDSISSTSTWFRWWYGRHGRSTRSSFDQGVRADHWRNANGLVPERRGLGANEAKWDRLFVGMVYDRPAELRVKGFSTKAGGALLSIGARGCLFFFASDSCDGCSGGLGAGAGGLETANNAAAICPGAVGRRRPSSLSFKLTSVAARGRAGAAAIASGAAMTMLGRFGAGVGAGAGAVAGLLAPGGTETMIFEGTGATGM
jgi:hypothetical protein